METNQDLLRKALDHVTNPPKNLTQSSPPADWDAWLSSQVRVVAGLANLYPHGIHLHTQCSAAEERNCFMFAFGMSADAVRDECRGPIFPGKKFVQSLADKMLLRARSGSISHAEDGDILIYYYNSEPEHAGIWTNKKVISKWGSGPTNIWEHNIYEVPKKYGDEVRAYCPRGDFVKVFKDWSRSQGIRKHT